MTTKFDLEVRNDSEDYNKREHLSISFTVLQSVTEEDYKTLKEAIEVLETVARKYINEEK